MEDAPACLVAINPDPTTGGCLFVSVKLRNETAGSAQAEAALVRVTTDTALTGQATLEADRDPEHNQVPVSLRPGDYGRAHAVTITADPDNAVAEGNEANNVMKISVIVPASSEVSVHCPAETTSSATAGNGLPGNGSIADAQVTGPALP